MASEKVYIKFQYYISGLVNSSPFGTISTPLVSHFVAILRRLLPVRRRLSHCSLPCQILVPAALMLTCATLPTAPPTLLLLSGKLSGLAKHPYHPQDFQHEGEKRKKRLASPA